MVLGWLSDCHLNILDHRGRQAFFEHLKKHKCDAYVISGDIGDANCTPAYLLEIVKVIDRPIYFSLGNHDYYHDSIRSVQMQMSSLTKNHPQLFWLRDSGVIELTKDTAMVGVDGWADARYAPIESANFNVNDNNYIYDLLAAKRTHHLVDTMRYFADIDAKILNQVLFEALKKPYSTIYIITHVPPFSAYENDFQEQKYKLPFYSCKAMGDVCLSIANQYPDRRFIIHSGHTHNNTTHEVLSNLTMHTAFSQYGDPQIAGDIIVQGG